MRSVKPPFGLSEPGRRLWASCLRRDDSLADSDNPLRFVLHDACRTADHIERMQEILERDGLEVTTATGNAKAHPMLVELGKSQALQARLIVSLRMPDKQTGKKPQYRGSRVQAAPKSAASGVSSLERERARRAAGA